MQRRRHDLAPREHLAERDRSGVVLPDEVQGGAGVGSRAGPERVGQRVTAVPALGDPAPAECCSFAVDVRERTGSGRSKVPPSCRSDRSTSTSPTRPPTRSTTSPRRTATSTTGTTSTCTRAATSCSSITGLGQYPNLGVTDAFITVSIGTEQHTVRASRELGSDRMDTSVGPLSVEVLEGLRTLRIRCDDNEWGISADLVFTGSVAALEEPRTFIRRYGPRDPGRQPLRAGRRVGGHHHRGRADVRRHARPVEGRARPIVGRAARR